MDTVQSKYINPDKHIRKLKAEIERLERVNDNAHSRIQEEVINTAAARGIHLFYYTDGGSRFEETVNIANGKKIKIGSTLKLTGQVKKLEIVGDRIEYRVALVNAFELEED